MGMLISLDGGRIYSGNRLPENTSHAKGHLCKREQDIIINFFACDFKQGDPRCQSQLFVKQTINWAQTSNKIISVRNKDSINRSQSNKYIKHYHAEPPFGDGSQIWRPPSS